MKSEEGMRPGNGRHAQTRRNDMEKPRLKFVVPVRFTGTVVVEVPASVPEPRRERWRQGRPRPAGADDEEPGRPRGRRLRGVPGGVRARQGNRRWGLGRVPDAGRERAVVAASRPRPCRSRTACRQGGSRRLAARRPGRGRPRPGRPASLPASTTGGWRSRSATWSRGWESRTRSGRSTRPSRRTGKKGKGNRPLTR